MSHNARPSRYAVSQSKARIFVGQLEPYVTEQDLYPVFSCYGKILHLNIVRHSTTVTPNEERRIPTAFVWYETTTEADAAIAALHNVFTFSSPDEEENKVRYIQVSYADKSPECTPWGRWQKTQAEIMRRTNPSGTGTGSNNMPGQYSHITGGGASTYSSPALNNGGGFTVSATGPAIRSSESSGDISSMRYTRNPARGLRAMAPHIDHPEVQYYGSYDNLYNLGNRNQLYSMGGAANSMTGYTKHRGMPPHESASSGDLGRGSTSSFWNMSEEVKKSTAADPNRFRHTARYTAPEPDEDLIMAAPTFTVTSGP
ncbi:RNA recognition motif. (a.k.a. RRM RBD or RNP domain) [Leishmania donovani]|uniref:RNA recognition motif family protein n=1 Tax=Leishmania donovani TaxID=5661 RepID=A0A504WZM4_LEIDO|nr:RNA recognition motif family protein [Leishmania donovani]CAJ1991484.1 RNA recognition motif. (a.k.a. RRM RBD or RNP domain) [Leishmania donovani]VDZ47325.1 RNA_recognition_motif._(a.k.a._RRM_RBD_or_RNP_domain)_putative/Pfam:PF00076 [Leishmania donovani]